MKIIEPINDDRLTPTMKRLRSGVTQQFREPKEGDLSFISSENCDVSLEHEKKSAYAELIDGKWYWVEGCAECRGEPRDNWKSYIECEEHDVCVGCGTKRVDIKEDSVWGGQYGWTCHTCHDIQRDEARREAFEKFNDADYSDYDFDYNDEILCPHCGTEINSDDVHENEELQCHVCDGKLDVEVHWTCTYSTSIVGERVTS